MALTLTLTLTLVLYSPCVCIHNQCDPSAKTTYSTGYSKAQRSLAGSTARSSANTAGPGPPSVLPSSTLGWVAGKVRVIRDGTHLIFMAHIHRGLISSASLYNLLFLPGFLPQYRDFSTYQSTHGS
jgi:hypothetical protein